MQRLFHNQNNLGACRIVGDDFDKNIYPHTLDMWAGSVQSLGDMWTCSVPAQSLGFTVDMCTGKVSVIYLGHVDS